MCPLHLEKAPGRRDRSEGMPETMPVPCLLASCRFLASYTCLYVSCDNFENKSGRGHFLAARRVRYGDAFET